MAVVLTPAASALALRGFLPRTCVNDQQRCNILTVGALRLSQREILR